MTKYALRWDVEHKKGGYSVKEIGKKDGADALIVISIIKCLHGNLDFKLVSTDENREPLNLDTLFRGWLVYTMMLAMEFEFLSPKFSPEAALIHKASIDAAKYFDKERK